MKKIFMMTVLFVLAGCTSETSSGLSGTVSVDGSSTVFPITEAVAEEFGKEHPGVRLTVGISGTGGGFKKFSMGEIDINNASRIIKEKELAACKKAGVDYIELPVAFDGISITVNAQNDWVDYLTVEELSQIWSLGSDVHRWSDVRRGWPDVAIKLYAPGSDSGTFDYFTKAINGKEGACRGDYFASEDDNMLVSGVSRDKNGLAFFGFAFYKENKNILRAVPIDSGEGPVPPSLETISDGTYRPLSRPIFVYINRSSKKSPEVDAFMIYYLTNVKNFCTEVGYIPLPEDLYQVLRRRYDEEILGSVFHTDGAKESSLEKLYGVD